MSEFSVNNPNGYLAGPLGSFRVYGPDGRLKAIGAGGGGGATWGTITGNITNQTDLIDYITNHAGGVPTSRTLSINGVTYDLSADRSWTIPVGGTVTDVTGTGTVSGLTLSGTGTTSVTLTLGGLLSLTSSNVTDALGYTPYNSTNPAGYLAQSKADTLYYPLSSNPSSYVTSSSLSLTLSDYLKTSTAASTYLTISNAATTYQPIFSAQNGLTLASGYLKLGGQLDQATTIDGKNTHNLSIIDVGELKLKSNDGTNSTEILLNPTEIQIKTPLYSSASVGDVLTILDPGTGEAEWQTPTGGSSPLSMKGDLYTYDTADTRLPVGTDGQILYSDSTTSTGLKWDTPPTGGGGIPFAVASGTDTYTATISGVTSYTDGDAYLIRFTNGNTDAATLDINSLGAIPLHQNNQVPLIGGDIWTGGEMLCIYNSADTSFECIGTSPNSLFAYVTNAEASTISKGQVVYAFGGTGNRITVKLARANADSTSAQTIGFVFSTSIAAGQKGIIIVQGYLSGLSLFPTSSSWVDGDPVYLSPTTAGAVTRTKPLAPSHLVYLGVVATASNGSSGRMYVRVQNGYELDEIHDVAISNPLDRQTLFYNASTTLWENRGIQAADIPSVTSNATFGVTVDGGGGVISNGVKGYVKIPYACTITGWTVMSTISGSITFDIWKSSSGLPTVANTIIAAGGTKPNLTTQTLRNSSSLANWTTSIAANDYLAFNVDSATSVTWAVVQIFITK